MKDFVKMSLPSLTKFGRWIYYEDPVKGQAWEIYIRGKIKNAEFEHAVGKVRLGDELFVNTIVRIARNIENGQTIISIS